MKYKKMSNIDADYAYYAACTGLYAIAFFGHKSTKAQKRKLKYIWNRLLKIYSNK